MNVQEAEKHLRAYLLQGIGEEIFWADEAYALALEIDKHAEQINAAGFGPLRTSLVTILSDRQTLSITRYSTRLIVSTRRGVFRSS